MKKMNELKKAQILINYYGKDHDIVNEYIDNLFENNFEEAEKIWKKFEKTMDNPGDICYN